MSGFINNGLWNPLNYPYYGFYDFTKNNDHIIVRKGSFPHILKYEGTIKILNDKVILTFTKEGEFKMEDIEPIIIETNYVIEEGTFIDQNNNEFYKKITFSKDPIKINQTYDIQDQDTHEQLVFYYESSQVSQQRREKIKKLCDERGIKFIQMRNF